MTALVRIDSVNKTFHAGGRSVKAVRDVSLEIQPGEVVGLVGESGSGKSTLASLLLGLASPDSGSIEFKGQALDSWLRGDPRGYRACVQAVFQHPVQALDRRKRIEWIVAEPLVIHGRGTRAERSARVSELMAAVHLDEELLGRYPHQLSGGQAQRVNIARALALEPELLICDEAVSALDVSVQAQILNLLLELQQKRELAMLFISHSLPVVRHISDRVIVMYAGEVVEDGPGRELTERPRHPYTQLLISSAALVDGPVVDVPRRVGEGLPTTGCRFSPRCALVDDTCRSSDPTLEALEPDHHVRCWHPPTDTQPKHAEVPVSEELMPRA